MCNAVKSRRLDPVAPGREAESCFVLPLHPGSAEDASEDGDDALLSCGWSSRHAGGLSRAKVNHTILE